MVCRKKIKKLQKRYIGETGRKHN